MHAFAGDDRGWHLLAVIERATHLVGSDIQRLGLSATVGNAEELLGWLAGSSRAPRVVVAPSDEATSASPAKVDFTLDYVGNLTGKKDSEVTIRGRYNFVWHPVAESTKCTWVFVEPTR